MNKTSKINWKDELKEKGYVVIPGVLSERECDRHVRKLARTMNHVVADGDWEGFVNTRASNGVIHGLDNLRTLWEVRSTPLIGRLFQELYNTCDKDRKESLYLYIDRFNYRPPKLNLPFESNWHVDEDPFYPQSDYQGFVSLTNITQQDACLGILEGSHRVIQKFPGSQPFSDKDLEWFKTQGCAERRVETPKGSLVIWDSGCVHNPLNSLRKTPIRRAVVYVRYFPTSRFPIEYRHYPLRTYPEYVNKKGIDCLTPQQILDQYEPLIYGL
jgi:hypothetical protein